MSYSSKKSNFTNKKIAVVGLGITGQALINFFLKQKAEVSALDQNLKINEKLKKLPVRFSLGKNYLKDLEQFDLIFISPGVPLNLPPIKRIKDKTKISSEIVLFFEYCQAPIIGITGTNGKSTTTTLITKILKKAQKRVFLGGNIGKSLINKVNKIKKDSWVILELSSFQLELVKKSPHIAVILNITPDHLDRYSNFEEYQKAKLKIIQFQSKKDYAILNFDDPITYRFKNKTSASVWGFSTKKFLKKGAYLKDDNLVIRDKKIIPLCPRQEIQLPGEHNLQNILAASLVAYLVGVNPQIIKKVITRFKGLPHRLELVAVKNQIKFYNDSKATTPSSTIAALKSFTEPIILIAGGSDKKINFSPLAKIIVKKAKLLIVMGETSEKITKSVKKIKNNFKVIRAFSLKEAVGKAFRNANPGEVILLSPACASFDMFINFEERGNLFKKFVKELH